MSQVLQILSGITVLFQPINIFYIFLGYFVGLIFGALPGLTSMLAIVLLLPMTYSMPITQALILCMAVYMSGIYAGSITAVTLKIPGAPSAIMTCIEGNAMYKKGHGAKAIGHATIASAIGGTIGALLLIFVSPLAVKLALKIRTPGKCALVFFALVVMVIISKDKRKGLIVMLFGLACSTIGMDPLIAKSRLTFGIPQLLEGLDTTTLIVGAFALSEILSQCLVNNAEYKAMLDKASAVKFKRKDFFPTWKEMKEIGLWLYIKSAIMGYFIGVLPGAGASMAAFVAYAEAKRTSKYPELFGNGCPEGIAAPECANNAVCGGALVPMLSLGIPGDGTTAVLLGVFMIYGIVPGPTLLTEQINVLAPMYMALLISAAVMLPLSLYIFGPYYMKIVRINRLVLYSAIAVISILGVYAATTSAFQMGIALVVAILMFFLKKQNYPTVPFILGVILGDLFEEYLRTTLTKSNMNPLIFLTQPDSLVFVILTVIFVIWLPRLNKSSDDGAEKMLKK